MYAKIHLKSVKLFKQKRNKKIRTNYGMIGIVKIKKMKPRIFLKKIIKSSGSRTQRKIQKKNETI